MRPARDGLAISTAPTLRKNAVRPFGLTIPLITKPVVGAFG
jgi:hypothetical protein